MLIKRLVSTQTRLVFIEQDPIDRMHYRIIFLLVAASKVAILPLCWWCYCSRATCEQNYAELSVDHSRSKTCRLASALDLEFHNLSSSPYGHWKPVRVSLSGLGEMNQAFHIYLLPISARASTGARLAQGLDESQLRGSLSNLNAGINGFSRAVRDVENETEVYLE